ncbi:MAG: DUF4954 family protein, partial [Bacteroidetes bacterium]|nr:DUF4954 family protein [Bacteroidota bacterium]
RLKEFTSAAFDNHRGYYGKVGDRTVIKNCKIIKDVWIGSDAYLKGANKLKNLTINSGPQAKSQIGEGCEMVNGIVGFGCRVFYGVKAVRFIMASHSQLKYGARLINSYLGNNATISCCEVLNSLIFPAHEQHHNNSFLCAALVMGQSNMAAGATIGSNHNSRSPDGEIIAGRGFWPGLCVSLKHNSRFASFAILAKGDYPAELDIPIPFSLISNDVSKDELIVMPAYWFLHNMYALARNSWKYIDRDRRTDKTQTLEFSFLAPDTINEMIDSIKQIERFTGQALARQQAKPSKYTDEELIQLGAEYLTNPARPNAPAQNTELEILAEGWENTDRKVKLIKAPQARNIFRELVIHHAINQLLPLIKENKIKSLDQLQKALSSNTALTTWVNAGGQLIRETELQKLIDGIHKGRVKSWDQIHQFYIRQGEQYTSDKLQHALAALKAVTGINIRRAKPAQLKQLLEQSLATKEWMTREIHTSRAKDYTNPFRQMVYESTEEMNAVVGRLQDNGFIKQEKENLKKYRKEIETAISQLT